MGRTDFNLVVLDIASGRETVLTSSSHEESYPSWSIDGSHIFYSSDLNNEAGKTNIFVMRADGSHPQQLTSHPDKDAYAFSSPDGTYLYFMSYRSPQGVYRMRLNSEYQCEKN